MAFVFIIIFLFIPAVVWLTKISLFAKILLSLDWLVVLGMVGFYVQIGVGHGYGRDCLVKNVRLISEKLKYGKQMELAEELKAYLERGESGWPEIKQVPEAKKSKVLNR